jgi:hypothetical protein
VFGYVELPFAFSGVLIASFTLEMISRNGESVVIVWWPVSSYLGGERSGMISVGQERARFFGSVVVSNLSTIRKF